VFGRRHPPRDSHHKEDLMLLRALFDRDGPVEAIVRQLAQSRRCSIDRIYEMIDEALDRLAKRI
jgi:hypothetical protein